MRTLGDYRDLCVTVDVLFSDIFENFGTLCQNYYKIDPCNTYTIPGLKSLAIRLTFAERSFLTLADGAKYSLSCQEQITQFLNFYTLTDVAHKILASLVERKSPSPDIHTALTGGAHRFQLLLSRGKDRLPLAWHSQCYRSVRVAT
ncbi:zinc finger protein [Trichonephila clavipes]|nr:zinc finger protein [Trichonephila clavipes]